MTAQACSSLIGPLKLFIIAARLRLEFESWTSGLAFLLLPLLVDGKLPSEATKLFRGLPELGTPQLDLVEVIVSTNVEQVHASISSLNFSLGFTPRNRVTE